MNDQQIRQVAEALASARKAYEQGLRIEESMTYEQAKLLDFGRRMYEICKGREPNNGSSNIIDATSRFKGVPDGCH